MRGDVSLSCVHVCFDWCGCAYVQEHLSTFAAAASNYKQAAVLAKDADEEEEAAKLFAKVRDDMRYSIYMYSI